MVLPNAGHRCYEDAPDAFHRVLLKFLTKCHRGPAGEHVVKPDSAVKIELL